MIVIASRRYNQLTVVVEQQTPLIRNHCTTCARLYIEINTSYRAHVNIVARMPPPAITFPTARMLALPPRPACVASALAGTKSSYEKLIEEVKNTPWRRLRSRIVKQTADVVLMRRLAQSRARLAALDKIASGSTDSKSYKDQGDESMYSYAAIEKRARLRTAPEVSAAVRAVWAHLTSHLPSGSKVIRK